MGAGLLVVSTDGSTAAGEGQQQNAEEGTFRRQPALFWFRFETVLHNEPPPMTTVRVVILILVVVIRFVLLLLLVLHLLR